MQQPVIFDHLHSRETFRLPGCPRSEQVSKEHGLEVLVHRTLLPENPEHIQVRPCLFSKEDRRHETEH